MDADERLPFAQVLRQLRRDAGLTQQELAERSGISARSVSDLEREVALRPHRDTAVMLADGLQLAGVQRDAFLAAARGRTPASPHGRMTNLPTAPDTLLGRAEEVRTIEAALRTEGAPLLTLTGPGGVGKTRLAIEIARRASAHYADGVAFVRLEGVADPDLVLPTLATSLLLLERGDRDVLDLLSEHLANREALIVLDNLEHLLEVAPRLATLRARCPRLQLLVTSREALRVAGERVVRVMPLPRPDPESWRTPAGVPHLAAAPAITLFQERARAVRRDLDIDPERDEGRRNLAIVAEICHRLDGLPLAIELAAAQVEALSPAAILALLRESGLPLLTAGGRDQPARLQTMDAAIDWSYGLVSPQDQVLFRLLSVFVGGFSLPAAVSLSGDAPGVSSRIASLARQNLLFEEPAESLQAAPRFRMLEPIRLFALDRLRAAGEEDEVRRRHAVFFANLAETLDARTLGPDPEVWLSQQAFDLDNFRAAIDWAFAAGEHHLAVRLTAAVAQFWIIKGMLAEGRQRLAAAMMVDGAAAPAVRWYLRFWAGNFALDAGDAASGAAQAQEMVTIAEAAGDPVGVGAGLTLLSRAKGMAPDGHEAAAALAERAVELLEPLGRGEWTGWAWSRLGIERQHLGLLEAARDCLVRSLEIRRAMRCEACVSYSLALLGGALLDLGQPAAARDAWRECLELTVKHENPTLMLAALLGLADVVWRAGAGEHPERLALHFWGAAEALRLRHGLGQGEEARQTIALWHEVMRGVIGDARVDEAIATGMAAPPAAIIDCARWFEVTGSPESGGMRAALPSLAAAVGNID